MFALTGEVKSYQGASMLVLVARMASATFDVIAAPCRRRSQACWWVMTGMMRTASLFVPLEHVQLRCVGGSLFEVGGDGSVVHILICGSQPHAGSQGSVCSKVQKLCFTRSFQPLAFACIRLTRTYSSTESGERGETAE